MSWHHRKKKTRMEQDGGCRKHMSSPDDSVNKGGAESCTVENRKQDSKDEERETEAVSGRCLF